MAANDTELWPSAHLAHNCEVLTLDAWICEDCGKTFDRDPNLGDYPETAIIEGECEAVLEQEEWESVKEAAKRWGVEPELGGEA